MATPQPALLRATDLRAAVLAVGDIADAAAGSHDFALAGVQVLSQLVCSELTTLSRWDLHSARRVVVGLPAGAVGADERAAFDRHFNDHPLVKYHAAQRGGSAHRISDSLTDAQFRATALYADYYRRVGLSHALALPLRMDGSELVSFVFNRQRRDFSDRELALLDALRRPLARLFDLACAAERPPLPVDDAAAGARFGLTRRNNRPSGQPHSAF